MRLGKRFSFLKAPIKTLSLLIGIGFVYSCSSGVSTSRESVSAVANQTDTLPKGEQKRIVFFGNSLTAGLGLSEQSLSFPGLISTRIDSLNLPYQVVNAGLSGETSAAGAERIAWLLKDSIHVFVLELGANDGLRGIPPSATKVNLQSIINQVKKVYPECKILLAGMMMPPSMGQTYTTSFQKIFPELARENNIDLIPFLLEGVAGLADFNQQDGIHPNQAGHQRLSEVVWPYLFPLL